MADLNEQIRAAIGQPNPTGTSNNGNKSIPANSAALRNIVTNGALLNQAVSEIVQSLTSLKTNWTS